MANLAKNGIRLRVRQRAGQTRRRGGGGVRGTPAAAKGAGWPDAHPRRRKWPTTPARLAGPLAARLSVRSGRQDAGSIRPRSAGILPARLTPTPKGRRRGIIKWRRPRPPCGVPPLVRTFLGGYHFRPPRAGSATALRGRLRGHGRRRERRIPKEGNLKGGADRGSRGGGIPAAAGSPATGRRRGCARGERGPAPWARALRAGRPRGERGGLRPGGGQPTAGARWRRCGAVAGHVASNRGAGSAAGAEGRGRGPR